MHLKRVPRVRIPLLPPSGYRLMVRTHGLYPCNSGSSPGIPTNLFPDVDEWFSHLADIQGSQKRRRFESCRQDKWRSTQVGEGASLLNW